MTDVDLSPRARSILAAVEREIAARQAAPPAPPDRPLRIDPSLLTALELAVGGASRDEVASALGVPSVTLDAVFGDGSGGSARLSRRG